MDADHQKSQWWVIARSEDFAAGEPLARRCLDEDYVLFRDDKGVVHALEDRCAHRRAPLSLGKVTEDGLVQCPYHGWSFEGSTGQCKRIPNLSADERVPPRYGVKHYATVEQGNFIFLWPGDPAGADRQKAPAPSIPTGEHQWSGSGLSVIPHGDFVETLLDAPGLVLDIEGISIADDYPVGDPVGRDGTIVTEFGAEWTKQAKKRKRLPIDFPLSVRITASTQGGLAKVEIQSDEGEVLSSVLIASRPATHVVTATNWQGACVRAISDKQRFAPQIVVREHLDAAALLAVKPNAGLMWRAAGGRTFSAAA